MKVSIFKKDITCDELHFFLNIVFHLFFTPFGIRKCNHLTTVPTYLVKDTSGYKKRIVVKYSVMYLHILFKI